MMKSVTSLRRATAPLSARLDQPRISSGSRCYSRRSGLENSSLITQVVLSLAAWRPSRYPPDESTWSASLDGYRSRWRSGRSSHRRHDFGQNARRSSRNPRGQGLGHNDILPARPPGHAKSDGTYPCSRPLSIGVSVRYQMAQDHPTTELLLLPFHADEGGCR